MRIVILILALLCSRSWALDSKNRFSAYTDLAEKEQLLGLSWTMDLVQSYQIAGFTLDGAYSLYSKYQSQWKHTHRAGMDAKSYRYYLSLQSPLSELRIGMQRLSFGSAQVLRPQRWFDQVDPLDPYQITTGVEAALFRHYWLNNANLWLWGVLGDHQLKGNEFIFGKANSAEFGGRIQYPMALGDAALSCHQRSLESGDEYRLGFDLRTDSVIGAWCESSASYNDTEFALPAYHYAGTLGIDYVFGVGNGIAATLEMMWLGMAESELKHLHHQDLQNAILISYPWGLLDSVQLLASFSEEFRKHHIKALWRRVYDYVALDFGLSEGSDSGWSFQIMLSADI